jgi:hypothetical protein
MMTSIRKILLVCAVGMMATAQPIEISENGGSYNSFLGQVGYCKQQSFETMSRGTSGSANVFQSGKVLFGVGLSREQFQRSIVSCGKCIEVLSVDRFYQFNHELTEWYYDKPNQGNFTVMVFDECTDPICESGFLDFDVYNEKQPVAYGNPTNLTWRFVPCPVGKDDKIEFLICLGYDSCQIQNEEGRYVENLYLKAVQDNWLTLYPRNFRIGITSVRVQGVDLEDIQSWVWKSMDKTPLGDAEWLIEWTNEDGSQQSWILDWTDYFGQTSTPGYRGGIVIKTDQQN